MDAFISRYYSSAEILTPEDGAHYFFAYYDMRATVGDQPHLCHRVGFMDRLPKRDDVCELGYLRDRKFHKFAETTAWNFQQGAMLQYHPTRPDTVYYNVCEDGRFMTVTHDLTTGEKRYTDRATACVSPDGRWGLAVNFGRIFAFRPGYGYAGFEDAYADVNAPAEDGAFLVDMQSGRSRLLVSYDQLARVTGFSPDQKILINHITFNASSDRFLMLVRNFMTEQHPNWYTSTVICDLEGNCRPLFEKSYFSHYYWLSDKELLAHCTVPGETKKSMYVIDVDAHTWVEYDMPYFHGTHNPDIHCNPSPDRRYIIGDGYDIDGYRYLMAYSLRTGKSRELFRAATVTPGGVTDIRCDPHARFVFGGSRISFDTTQNGRREVAAIDLRALDF